MSDFPIFFSGEDPLSESLARRCIEDMFPNAEFVGLRPSQGGKDFILEKMLPSYLSMSESQPFLLLLDQDNHICPPSYRREILKKGNASTVPSKMVLCIVTRESESWLLGDMASFASFLNVDMPKKDIEPENLEDAKATLLHLARKSRRFGRELCPEPNSSSKVGPGYNEVLDRFVRNHWRPNAAAKKCPSLNRAIERLKYLKELL